VFKTKLSQFLFCLFPQINECEEDSFPPELELEDGTCSQTFLTLADLRACVRRHLRWEDDCQPFDIDPITGGVENLGTEFAPILQYRVTTSRCGQTKTEQFGPFTICQPMDPLKPTYGCDMVDNNCNGEVGFDSVRKLFGEGVQSTQTLSLSWRLPLLSLALGLGLSSQHNRSTNAWKTPSRPPSTSPNTPSAPSGSLPGQHIRAG
jgi:hypothetical protein